jgi:hypothetical protein
MNFNTTNFPSNFSNLRGIPMIASTSVEVTTDNVVIGIPRRAFRGLADSGILAFRLTQEIPAGGAALPVVFSSNDFLQTLTVAGGTAATGAQITPTGVYLIWYDKCASLMQLLTPIA